MREAWNTMSMSPEAWAARRIFPWLDQESPTSKDHRTFLEALKKSSATQMKGLARVASEAEVAEQVITLVRYQMGRPRDPLPAPVGQRIIEEIHAIRRDAPAQDLPSQEDRDGWELERIRALLGQLGRWHAILTRDADGGAHARR